MKICYDQGCNDIGVVIATKWRHYLFYLQQYFSALGTVLSKSFTGAFSYNSRLDVREVSVKSVRALSRYFGKKFFMVRNTVKNWQSWCLTAKRFWHAISPHSSFNIFKNVCERSWRYFLPIARKKDLISMYRGALVSGNVNISVYFNKLANNF